MEFRRGIVAGIAAYVLWGGSPIYWNAIRKLPPAEVLACSVDVLRHPFVKNPIAVHKELEQRQLAHR